MKKTIGFLVILSFLVGCGESNKLTEIYNGMDAEETYERMIEHMNENITYYEEKMVVKDYLDEKEIGSGESLFKDGVVQNIIKVEKDGQITFYMAQDDKKNYYVIPSGDEYVMSEVDHDKDGDKVDGLQSSILDNEKYDLVKAERKDDGDSITITMQFEDEKERRHFEQIYIIGSHGFLQTVKYIEYENEDLEEVTKLRTYKFFNYNEKKSLDFEKVVKEMEEISD